MHKPGQPEQWGSVVLGVDVLQGHGKQSQPGKADYNKNHPSYPRTKEQYNPGRNQELQLPPDIFPMEGYDRENPHSPAGKAVRLGGIHQRILELIGEGNSRNEAVRQAKQEMRSQGRGDAGTISKKEIYRHKYQAEQPWKKISPFSSQVQGYPFI